MSDLNLESIQAAKDKAARTESDLTEYMRVVINGEYFLVEVNAVLSVLRPVPLTPVPMAPDHLMGVANVRGQIFCIVDPGKTLRLPNKRKDKTKDSRFLLLRHSRVHLGLWAEEILDLLLLKAPEKLADQNKDYLQGKLMTKHGELPVLKVEVLFD